MADFMVNTAQVREIAADMERQNEQLSQKLEECRQLIRHLTEGNIWKGEAADATAAAFEEFSARYFKQYKDVIEQYVNFLRVNVAQGYEDTEAANTTYADAFK